MNARERIHQLARERAIRIGNTTSCFSVEATDVIQYLDEESEKAERRAHLYAAISLAGLELDYRRIERRLIDEQLFRAGLPPMPPRAPYDPKLPHGADWIIAKAKETGLL